ncbi:MAG: PAS domain S-box protein [Verrucomicrobia bacterium]|nr:PAS domain S-box protein [Verrucomicrobiota bacterium]
MTPVADSPSSAVPSGPGSTVVVYRWFWAALAAALLVTGLVGWLHFQQRQTFERETAQQRHVRQARVNLNRGYLLASLTSDPAFPFNRDEGLALIRQSIADFASTLKDVAPDVRQTAAAFRTLAGDLDTALARWETEGSPENAAALRIAFGRMDRQAALLDAANERQLRELSARQLRTFVLAVGGAALLFASGLAAIVVAARASGREEAARRRGEEQAAAAHAERARLLVEAEQAHQALLKVVAEQQAAEAALRKSETRYRGLVETSFDWVWEVDTDCRYTYASPRVRELLGYDPTEVLGRTPFDFMPEAEAQRVRRAFEALIPGRQPIIALENTNLHRDGRLVVVETNGVPILGPDGTWLGYHGMDRDITARRAAEKVLRLRGAALEAAANAIVITDRSGVIEWANPAFTALSGWTLAEAAGHNLHELVNSGHHDAAFFSRMWDDILAGKVWRGEVVNRRQDGVVRTEEMTLTPLADENGVVQYCIAIKQDITERKTLDTQSRHAQRMEAIGTASVAP